MTTATLPEGFRIDQVERVIECALCSTGAGTDPVWGIPFDQASAELVAKVLREHPQYHCANCGPRQAIRACVACSTAYCKWCVAHVCA